ncbi:MAG: LamG domain-containing protein [Planctomycetes bacterium]|nr:LamG domain-containing protein [Planctomycetota bacterium]
MNKSISCLAVILLLQMVTGVGLATRITTDADTYVDQTGTTNRGSNPEIVVKTTRSGWLSTYTRVSWIHFDLSEKPPYVGDAKLCLIIKTVGDTGPVHFWGIKDGRSGDALGTDWTESTVTGANAPLSAPFSENEETTYLGTVNWTSADAPQSGDRIEISTPELVNFLNADTNNQVTILVVRDPDEVWTDFFSKEHDPAMAPTLFVSFAGAPIPENGAANVALNQVISWTAGLDPNDTTQAHPNLAYHNLYIQANDPNLADVAPLRIDNTGVTVSYTPPTELERGATYYWRVDEVMKDDTVYEGIPWFFEMVGFYPLITSQPASGLYTVYQGEAIEFAIEAVNPYTNDSTGLSYAWYKVGDPAMVSDSALLCIPECKAADQGVYYCEVTIDYNGYTATSNQFTIACLREVARWTLDQSDYVDGKYVDVIGGHNAEPNSVASQGIDPIFVPDFEGNEKKAVVINQGGWANSGTWDPSEYTNQISISAWIKWDGTGPATYGNGIISKAAGYGIDTDRWFFVIREDTSGTSENTGLWFYTAGPWLQVVDVVPANQWTHVCMTFDGAAFSIYVNGQLKGSKGGGRLDNAVNAPVVIGAKGTNDSPFPGALDDIRLFNYGITARDVAILYSDYTGISTCLNYPEMDFSGPEGKPDCIVNLYDFVEFASGWLGCGLVPACE